MLKIIGIILVILSGVLVGLSLSFRSAMHISFLREYIKFISYVKTEIKYTQRPLLQILENYSCNEFLFNQVNNCVVLSQKYSLDYAWKLTFSNLYFKYGVSLEEENIIKKFFSQLGNSGVDSQINYCDYNISIIKPYLEKLIETKNKDEKLPVVLGVCISLMLILIVI